MAKNISMPQRGGNRQGRGGKSSDSQNRGGQTDRPSKQGGEVEKRSNNRKERR